MSLYNSLPTIEYSGYRLADISKRLAIVKEVKNNPLLYQEYSIEGYESAENIAQDFYEDPKLYWLIFMMNDIIDPFYGWILSDAELTDFINDKYVDPNATHHTEVTEAGSTVITNNEYENIINESKRKIKIVRPEFISDISKRVKDALNA